MQLKHTGESTRHPPGTPRPTSRQNKQATDHAITHSPSGTVEKTSNNAGTNSDQNRYRNNPKTLDTNPHRNDHTYTPHSQASVNT